MSWSMKIFMRNFRYFFLFLSFCIISACNNGIKKNLVDQRNCTVPSLKEAYLEFKSSKYSKIIFKDNFLNVDDKCLHTLVVIKALDGKEKFQPAVWNNQDSKNSGKLIIISNRIYKGKLCKDYLSYLSANNKKYIYKGSACKGDSQFLDVKRLKFIVNDWYFYDFYFDQSAGRTKYKIWGNYRDPEVKDIYNSEKFISDCKKKPWIWNCISNN